MANCTGRFTAAGRAKLASLIRDTDQNPCLWIAWGTGTGDISDTDTALGSEVDRERAAVTRTSASVVTLTASFTFGSDGTLSEIGLFDAPSGGTMLYRGGYSTDSPTGVYDVESLSVSAEQTVDITIPITIRANAVSVSDVGIQKIADFLSASRV